MATTTQLSENSHQGFDGIKAALCLGSMEAKSNTASGMPLCLWREGIGSRSSGKERDAETGLDFFGARYYSGAQGRFTSPDWSAKPEPVPYAQFDDPQTLNLYAYVRNNPVAKADLDGHCYPLCTMAIGGFIGGVTGGAGEYLSQKLSGQNADWSKIRHAAAGGFIAGAAAGLAGPGAGLATTLALSTGGSIAGGMVERKLNGEKVVSGEMAVDAAGGILGGLAAKGVDKLIPEVKAGWTVSNGAGNSFVASFRTQAVAATENTVRNTVRVTADVVTETSLETTGNIVKDNIKTPAPSSSLPPIKRLEPIPCH